MSVTRSDEFDEGLTQIAEEEDGTPTPNVMRVSNKVEFTRHDSRGAEYLYINDSQDCGENITDEETSGYTQGNSRNYSEYSRLDSAGRHPSATGQDYNNVQIFDYSDGNTSVRLLPNQYQEMEDPGRRVQTEGFNSRNDDYEEFCFVNIEERSSKKPMVRLQDLEVIETTPSPKSKKENRLEQLRDELEKKKYQECTFSPRLNKKSDDEPKRNWEEFIKQQETHEKKRVNKLKVMRDDKKKKDDQERFFKPLISSGSRRILKARNQEEKKLPIHERLHLEQKRPIMNQINRVVQISKLKRRIKGRSSSPLEDDSEIEGQESNLTFHPQIGKHASRMHRDHNVTELLYEDAMRRNKQRDAEAHRKLTSPIRREAADKSDEYLIQKLKKDLSNTLENSAGRGQMFNYIALCNIMQKLSFIENDPQSDLKKYEAERSKMVKIWKILHGEQLDGVSVVNLKKFLVALMGLYSTSMTHHNQLTHDRVASPVPKEKGACRLSSGVVSTATPGSQEYSPASGRLSTQVDDLYDIDQPDDRYLLGFFDEHNEVFFSREEVKRIHKEFHSLYKMRNNSQTQSSPDKKAFIKLSPSSAKFSPQLSNKKSQRMAESYRQKMARRISPSDSKESFELSSYLHTSHTVVEARLKEERVKKEARRMQDCTFRPMINKRRMRLINDKENPNSLKAMMSAIDLHDGAQTERASTASEKEQVSSFKKLYALGLSKQKQRMKKSNSDDELDQLSLQEFSFLPSVNKDQLRFKFPTVSEKTDDSCKQSIKRHEQARKNHESKFNHQTEEALKSPNSGKHKIDFSLEHKSWKFGAHGSPVSTTSYDRLYCSSPKAGGNSEKKRSPKSSAKSSAVQSPRHFKSSGSKCASPRSHGPRSPDRTRDKAILHLDVRVNNKSKSIVVYESDTVEELVRKFSQMHGLKPDKEQKLAALLQSHLDGIKKNTEEDQMVKSPTVGSRSKAKC